MLEGLLPGAKDSVRRGRHPHLGHQLLCVELRSLDLRGRAARAEGGDAGILERALTATAGSLRVAERQAARAEPLPEPLTDREAAVLRLLDSDLSRREIGEALYVSVDTVKTHVRGIYRKLGVSTRQEAVERAHEVRVL